MHKMADTFVLEDIPWAWEVEEVVVGHTLSSGEGEGVEDKMEEGEGQVSEDCPSR